jgi:predicted nucleic acid-binding protein
VLVDANVLYSRVLRDFLLYSTEFGIISTVWSQAILSEVIEHLVANIPGFSTESGAILKQAMNDTFPLAQIDPKPEDFAAISDILLPDEDDRHVLAAAISANADILCTANTKDFPADAMFSLGLSVMTPDSLLSTLVAEYPDEMLLVLQRSIARLKGASNKTTIAALKAAGAPETARSIETLL